ncbi:MAG: MFS transporter, partial [Chloroflexi bacterium CG07_land_8_20_14_0_80_51_10]
MIYYGWIVAAGGMLVTSIWGLVYSYSVFFKPLQDEFGWTRAEVSSVVTIFLLVYALCSLAFGRLTDRYGPRVAIAAGALVLGTGIALCS